MVDWENLDGQAPFYATFFIMAHVLVVYAVRTLVEIRHGEKTWPYAFWMQFLMTVRICSTFYEEPIIIGAYGYYGFVVLTMFNFFVVHFFDQFPIPSSLQQVEDLFFSRRDGIMVPLFSIVGQLFGALFSYYSALGVWWLSRDHMEHHQKLWNVSDACVWKFQTTLIVPVVLQFFIGILMRLALVNSYTQKWPALVPMLYSLYYSIVPVIFGFPGFEPIFSMSRVLHCFLGYRDKTNWFMWTLAYIIMPHFGWCLYRICWLEKLRPSALKKSKKAQKEQDAEELEALKSAEEERRRVERQEAAERRRIATETRRREPAQAVPIQRAQGGGAKRGKGRK